MVRLIKLWLISLLLSKNDVHSSLNTLTWIDKPISLPYTKLQELLLNSVNCTNFVYHEKAKIHKMIRKDIKNSTTLISYHTRSTSSRKSDRQTMNLSESTMD